MNHSPAIARTSETDREPVKAPLQLSATRGRLALELVEPFRVGPLQVTELVWLLDGLRFPLDLSGGVARFRHRRGTLDYLVIEASLAKLGEYLTPGARQALGCPTLSLQLLPQDTGLTVGVQSEQFAAAFSAYFAPQDSLIRWVVCDARGCGLDVHSHAIALRVAQSMLGRTATRKGSLFSIHDWLTQLVREVLLDAGARMPNCDDVRWAWHTTEAGLRIVASSQQPEHTPPSHVLRALQLAVISESGDDALVADQNEAAREAYTQALEAAPRHPDLALRISELDILAGHNASSALATIVETMPALDGGIVAASLLSKVGDTDGSVVALGRACAAESYAPLAARMLGEAALNVREMQHKLSLLDDALALCPSCDALRWRRAQLHLKQGRSEQCIEDLGLLEAGARGSARRFDVCLRGGRMLMEARLAREARGYFDRALRYCPRSAQASAELARAFFATGDGLRGVGLLARAVSLMQNENAPDPAVILELATAIAEHTADLPAAVYQARRVPFGVAQTIGARALEGRWRNQLGDIAGASHAFAQARQAATHLPLATVTDNVAWLVEAARFEFEVRRDPKTAKAHAMMALRASPRDTNILALFREIATAQQQAESHHESAPADVHNHAPDTPDESADSHGITNVVAPESEPNADDTSEVGVENSVEFNAELLEQQIQIEQRIDQLTDQVRSNPNDNDAVMELCAHLFDAGRLMDLLALVSARLEEITQEHMRERLMELRANALRALIRVCNEEGRTGEAEMYELLLQGDL